ncbi:MAG TPA: hypothetical protein DCX54_04725 [Flavobacteriales bacterium]|nr:hypothetical protein [Flavobacteriales bacterium]
MKRVVYAVFAAFLISCSPSENSGVDTDLINNPNSADDSGEQIGMPTIVFDEESYDFGEISQGEKVEHRFSFTNTGDADLIISSATGSCGCTVPSYPKEPVKPGGKSEITVVFASNGKKGAQHKRITIVANTNPNKTVIAIMGNVLVPEEES